MEHLLVGQRLFLRLQQGRLGGGLRRVVLAEGEQVLPVQIQQHLGGRGPLTAHVVPVKGDQIEVLKALKRFDLPLVDVVQHLGVHIGLHLPDAGHGQYLSHGGLSPLSLSQVFQAAVLWRQAIIESGALPQGGQESNDDRHKGQCYKQQQCADKQYFRCYEQERSEKQKNPHRDNLCDHQHQPVPTDSTAVQVRARFSSISKMAWITFQEIYRETPKATVSRSISSQVSPVMPSSSPTHRMPV